MKPGQSYVQVSCHSDMTRTFTFDPRDLAGLPAAILQDPTGAGTMHGACFLGFALLKAELATVDEILGDYGLVHELAHIRELGPSVTPVAASVEQLAAFAQRLLERLP